MSRVGKELGDTRTGAGGTIVGRAVCELNCGLEDMPNVACSGNQLVCTCQRPACRCYIAGEMASRLLIPSGEVSENIVVM